MVRKPQTTHRDGKGWLETEWTEGAAKNTGRPVHAKVSRPEATGGGRRTTPELARPGRSVGRPGRYEAADAPSGHGPWTGVRASIVALKPGNAGGAKGRRKVEVEC